MAGLFRAVGQFSQFVAGALLLHHLPAPGPQTLESSSKGRPAHKAKSHAEAETKGASGRLKGQASGARASEASGQLKGQAAGAEASASQQTLHMSLIIPQQ